MQVRTIDGDELVAWVEASHVPFANRSSATEEAEFRRTRIDFARTWAAVEADHIVGTLRSFATEMTLAGGGGLIADAVTNVGVSPTHRRQGVMTTLVHNALRMAANRQEPLSILIAAEYPIYGRFGYGPATEHASYAIDTRRAQFRGSAYGRVQLVEADVGRQAAMRVFDEFRRLHPGAIVRREYWWDLDMGLIEAFGQPRWRGFCVVYRDVDDQPKGLLRYHVDETWDQRLPKGTVVIDELLSVTPAAYAALWRYCCELDLVTSISAGDRRVDEPLPWLLSDARAVRQTARADFLWVRILDVPRALSTRGYLYEGRAVFDVIDSLGYGAGRFVLEAGPAGARCQTTTESAELSLGVQALGAAYLGGTNVSALVEAGLIEEHTPGAADSLDALLRTRRAPWCNTWF
jgi:predicted acetyltransferase